MPDVALFAGRGRIGEPPVQFPLLFADAQKCSIILTVSAGLLKEVVLGGRGVGRGKQAGRWVEARSCSGRPLAATAGRQCPNSEEAMGSLTLLPPLALLLWCLPPACPTGMGGGCAWPPDPATAELRSPVMPLRVPSCPGSSHSCLFLPLQGTLRALPASCFSTGEALALAAQPQGRHAQEPACSEGQRGWGTGQAHRGCRWEPGER